MKKSILYLAALLALLAVSCVGPEGPPGFDGFDGRDGLNGLDGVQGKVLEIDGVNFDYDDSANLHFTLLNYGDFTDFEVSESYAVLIYRYDGEVELSDGPANNWSLIPQNFFTQDGTIQYTYAHNFVDTELFIDGNYDLINLSGDFTQNQFFRIVFVPSDFLSSKFDKSNIDAVMEHFGMNQEDIQKIELD